MESQQQARTSPGRRDQPHRRAPGIEEGNHRQAPNRDPAQVRHPHGTRALCCCRPAPFRRDQNRGLRPQPGQEGLRPPPGEKPRGRPRPTPASRWKGRGRPSDVTPTRRWRPTGYWRSITTDRAPARRRSGTAGRRSATLPPRDTRQSRRRNWKDSLEG